MHNMKNKFSGHQTFSFRYGWLEKGYRFICEGKDFNNDYAIVDLGVGKNMVDSIKYWCEMTGVLSEGEITEFGLSLLDEKNGWDPFLEDNASLWLLHWNLVTNSDYLTAGNAMFSYLHKPEFTKHDIGGAIVRLLDQDNKKQPTDTVILRDIDCYVRSYAGTKRFDTAKSNEESFDCPLQELGLIHQMSETEMYRFAIGPKLSLPPEIIGYAVCEYLKKHQNRSSIRIQEALYREQSPGQVFMLDENSLIEAINTLHLNPLWESKISFTESAGIALIHCTLEDGNELLKYYYNKGRF